METHKDNGSDYKTSYTPWTEKYRPKFLAELKQSYADRMKRLICIGKQLNYLLIGEPGIGKTTTAMCLCNDTFCSDGEYYDENSHKNYFRIINASNERTVSDVYKNVHNFAKSSYTRPSKRSTDGIEQNFKKIIVFDEADNMTSKAQQLLFLMMEKYDKYVQFVITANDSEGIHQRIKSACLTVYCTHPDVTMQCSYLAHICESEGIEYTMNGLEMIVHFARMDLRQATNAVQSVATTQGKVTDSTVGVVCETYSTDEIGNWMRACCAKNHQKAREIFSGILDGGSMPSDVMYAIHKILLEKCPQRVPDTVVAKWIEVMTDVILDIGNINMTRIQIEAIGEKFLHVACILCK